jgi:hypothetical protein
MEQAQSPPPEPLPQQQYETVYACKRCRAPLFRPSLLTHHEVGAQQFSYRRVQKDRKDAASGGGGASGGGKWPSQEEGGEEGGEGSSPSEPGASSQGSARCTSHFLAEAVQWMESASKDVEGRLSCPGCNARVGTLAWAGSQCSCGTWVNPAIQIQKKQVEEKRILVVGGAGAGEPQGSAAVAPT